LDVATLWRYLSEYWSGAGRSISADLGITDAFACRRNVVASPHAANTRYYGCLGLLDGIQVIASSAIFPAARTNTTRHCFVETVYPMTEKPTRTDHLNDSRSRIGIWLEHDRLDSHKSQFGGAVRDTLPFFKAIWGHPSTAMVLGAIAKAWNRTDTNSPAKADELDPLNFIVSQARQHPKAALFALGVVSVAAVYWINHHHKPPASN
jgi:hypothetical protein